MRVPSFVALTFLGGLAAHAQELTPDESFRDASWSRESAERTWLTVWPEAIDDTRVVLVGSEKGRMQAGVYDLTTREMKTFALNLPAADQLLRLSKGRFLVYGLEAVSIFDVDTAKPLSNYNMRGQRIDALAANVVAGHPVVITANLTKDDKRAFTANVLAPDTYAVAKAITLAEDDPKLSPWTGLWHIDGDGFIYAAGDTEAGSFAHVWQLTLSGDSFDVKQVVKARPCTSPVGQRPGFASLSTAEGTTGVTFHQLVSSWEVGKRAYQAVTVSISRTGAATSTVVPVTGLKTEITRPRVAYRKGDVLTFAHFADEGTGKAHYTTIDFKSGRAVKTAELQLVKKSGEPLAGAVGSHLGLVKAGKRHLQAVSVLSGTSSGVVWNACTLKP
jgi:hypothetical protein